VSREQVGCSSVWFENKRRESIMTSSVHHLCQATTDVGVFEIIEQSFSTSPCHGARSARCRWTQRSGRVSTVRPYTQHQRAAATRLRWRRRARSLSVRLLHSFNSSVFVWTMHTSSCSASWYRCWLVQVNRDLYQSVPTPQHSTQLKDSTCTW
jgi:hypothetical protein